MSLSSSNKDGLSGTQKVKDPSAIFWTIIAMIILGVPSLLVNMGLFRVLFGGFSDMNSGDWLWGLFFFLLCNSLVLIAAFRLRVIWNGIEVNIGERTMEFQGGGIDANEFTDYFKPNYFLQFFKRFQVNIDEISQISANDSQTSRYNEQSKQVVTSYRYNIQFVGMFGTATVNFNSSGKRDQIYNIIRQLNSMGDPYIKAN